MKDIFDTNSILHLLALGKWGADVVIHANHLLRAWYPAMLDVAESILANSRSQEVEKADKVMSVKKIISMF